MTGNMMADVLLLIVIGVLLLGALTFIALLVLSPWGVMLALAIESPWGLAIYAFFESVYQKVKQTNMQNNQVGQPSPNQQNEMKPLRLQVLKEYIKEKQYSRNQTASVKRYSSWKHAGKISLWGLYILYLIVNTAVLLDLLKRDNQDMISLVFTAITIMLILPWSAYFLCRTLYRVYRSVRRV